MDGSYTVKIPLPPPANPRFEEYEAYGMNHFEAAVDACRQYILQHGNNSFVLKTRLYHHSPDRIVVVDSEGYARAFAAHDVFEALMDTLL